MHCSAATSMKWLRGLCVCAPFMLASTLLSSTFLSSSAMAQDAAPATPQSPPEAAASNNKVEPQKSIWERDKLLGDLGGVRKLFEDKGITLNATEISEGLGNPTGGIRQGAIYEGALLAVLGVDTEKLAGWKGGKFNVSAYEIRGRGLSANDLGNWNIASSIEARDTVRLFELWYEQSVADGKASVRFGQLAADQEFINSQYAALFINSGFGWPTLPAAVLPSGGPAYPLATPGVRLKAQINNELTVLTAIFNGDPADNGSGTSFRLDKGVFAMAEAQYAVNGGDKAVGLPGTYKLGAWYNSNHFPDLAYSNDGLSLANPLSNGVPLDHRGNWNVYFVADQLLYRPPGAKDQGLGAFVRMMASPDDRSIISYFLNAGLTYKGLIPGRGDDTAGVGVLYAKASDRQAQLDQATAFFSGAPFPVQDAETMIEATYQIQLAPWWALQPDFQYLFHPMGGVLNPNNPTQTIPDAAIFGLRTTIIF